MSSCFLTIRRSSKCILVLWLSRNLDQGQWQKFGLKTLKKWRKVAKINPWNSEYYRNWLLETLTCVLTVSRYVHSLSKQCFAKTLDRFAKKLSFTYLKNGLVNCLRSVLEALLRCLWNIFLRCLINTV